MGSKTVKLQKEPKSSLELIKMMTESLFLGEVSL